jgi:hypothetical protein
MRDVLVLAGVLDDSSSPLDTEAEENLFGDELRCETILRILEDTICQDAGVLHDPLAGHPSGNLLHIGGIGPVYLGVFHGGLLGWSRGLIEHNGCGSDG